MRVVRSFFGLLILAGFAFGVAYYYAGTLDGPAVTDESAVRDGRGARSTSALTRRQASSALNIQLGQKGRTFAILDRDVSSCRRCRHPRRSIHVTRPMGKKTLPGADGRSGDTEVSARRGPFSGG